MNIIYLVIFVLGGNGITSQSIPQANMAQCLANAKVFNTNSNKKLTTNSYSTSANTQSALCIVGVK